MNDEKVAGILFLLALFGLPVSAQELSLFGPLPISPMPVSPAAGGHLLQHLPPTPHLEKPHLDKPTRATSFSTGRRIYVSDAAGSQRPPAEHEWIFHVRSTIAFFAG